MEFLGPVISAIIKDGQLTIESLLLIVAALILYGYLKILKPMKQKLDEVPSLLQIQELNDKIRDQEKVNVDDLVKKLDNILDGLDEVSDLEGNQYRELLSLKRDIEQIKQILNQFQGHMMYGGSRRSSDFGNKELK